MKVSRYESISQHAIDELDIEMRVEYASYVPLSSCGDKDRTLDELSSYQNKHSLTSWLENWATLAFLRMKEQTNMFDISEKEKGNLKQRRDFNKIKFIRQKQKGKKK